jgi:hypothetical protein
MERLPDIIDLPMAGGPASSGGLAAIVVAVLAWIALPLAILVTAVALAIPVLAIAYYVLTDRGPPEA